MRYVVDFFDKSWRYSQKSFSQEGEDLVLEHFMGNKMGGFYVDVGAHHPFRFSNTYYFYKKGWKGINIDATPGSMVQFDKYRPRDINLEIPIANNNQKIDYYIFDEPALNGFSATLSKNRDKNTPYKIKTIVKLKTQKLSQVLDKYLPMGTVIDFLTIDVEGYEQAVLTSNNWVKYQPKFILVEILFSRIDNVQNSQIYKFLTKKQYSLIAITGRTFIFKKT